MKMFRIKQMKSKTYTINGVINIFYIICITIMILFTIVFSSLITVKAVTDTTYDNVNNTVKERYNVLERLFDQSFEQIVYLNNDPNLIEVINHRDNELTQAINVNNNIRALFYRFQDVLDSIYININNGEYFFNGGDIVQDLSKISYNSFFTLSQKSDPYFWISSKESPFSTKIHKVISLCKTIGDDRSEVSGVIVFNIRYDYINETLSEGFITKNGGLFLVSTSGEVTPAQNKFPKELFKNIKAGNRSINVNRTLYHERVKKFPSNDWYLLAVFPDSDLQKSRQIYILFGVLLFMFLFGVVTLTTLVVRKYISKPIQSLAIKIEGTEITEQYSLLEKPELHFEELNVLNDSFRSMIRKNELLLKDNENNLAERSRLEIELLQSQINPHFLYNTLYSIQSLSEMGMSREAAEMCRSLAEFYRIGVSKGNVLIPLRDEVDHVQSYLQIMKFRYHDQFSFDIHISESELLTYRIPRISLQPIIENAIYHGLKEQNKKGSIKIRIDRIGQDILIAIKDNGRGISEENLKTINEEINLSAKNIRKVTGIGLRSVNLRIKKYFGEGYGAWLEDTTEGTLVKIVIPLEDNYENITDC